MLEALTYYAAVTKNQNALDQARVWRIERKMEFKWADVVKSNTVMVLANESFWKKARQNDDASNRICELVKLIADKLKIKVLLYKTPDVDFIKVPADKPGRYCPRMPDGADKWTPVFEKPPTDQD
jgi:hypothetical protein